MAYPHISVQSRRPTAKLVSLLIRRTDNPAHPIFSAPAPIDILWEIRQQKPDLFNKMEIYVDGGVKYGTDVVCPLASALLLFRAEALHLGQGSGSRRQGRRSRSGILVRERNSWRGRVHEDDRKCVGTGRWDSNAHRPFLDSPTEGDLHSNGVRRSTYRQGPQARNGQAFGIRTRNGMILLHVIVIIYLQRPFASELWSCCHQIQRLLRGKSLSSRTKAYLR